MDEYMYVHMCVCVQVGEVGGVLGIGNIVSQSLPHSMRRMGRNNEKGVMGWVICEKDFSRPFTVI